MFLFVQLAMKLPNLLHSYTYVADQILDDLTPAELGSLNSVDSSCNAYVSVYTSSKHNIYRVLRPFFDEDTEQFHHVQKFTGTLISGSQALRFMGRLHWKCHDLDLYTPPSTYHLV